ncbi:HEAT repeat domain-containing protein [Actinoplanes sp. NEAU-A12]|uniref:HEAT repeat domain-containing protein n=1 Tax=Actinoplanes sandaracinus TaxID=3045177 RepID=A0ABT6WZD2_9ACTN|nr:HEAT repeat domain-containing protein [Actinoplanes sandaracinus]MDI6105082.1 HEAT repeat domain-containing protein [Actinoplanes sandaracinus]
MLIGDVARRCGVSTRMLRHYDTLGLVQPTGRTHGNYREYSTDDIRRIFHVESLRTLGLSLRQIARALQDPAFTPATLVADLIRQTEHRLRQQQELLDRLRTVDASTPDDWPGVLRIVELLHGLHSPHAARRQQAILAPTDDTPVPTELLADAILTETDPNVAGALHWALARTGDDALTHLAPATTAPHPDTRRRAVRAIAEIPGDHATAILTRALDDPDPAVRAHAALAAGLRGATTAVPTLVTMVATGTNDVDAADILGTLAHDPAHTDQILTALTDELTAPTADSATRIRLTQALADMPPDAARPTLHRLTHDADRTVALLAAALTRAHAP